MARTLAWGRHHGDRRGAVAEGARSGMWTLARIVVAIAWVVVGLIVAGILLIVLEANPSSSIVEWVTDAARWLAGPFHDLFNLDGRKTEIAVNWGLAAVVYFAVASLIARLLRR